MKVGSSKVMISTLSRRATNLFVDNNSGLPFLSTKVFVERWGVRTHPLRRKDGGVRIHPLWPQIVGHGPILFREGSEGAAPTLSRPTEPMADIPENPGDPPADTVPPDYSGFQREDLIRYARHFVLPGVGPEGQRRLADARVLLVGAGGLGSPAALYLAAAGVGTLGIVDPDLVDLSNLQRQILHGISQLGQEKVESARQRLWDLNPNVDVNTHVVRLSGENAMEIIGDYDLVVDGSDNFPTRYLVNDACVLLKKPYVYGAVDRWSGQVSVFGTPGGPCYRCLFREPPPPGMVPSCAEAGVLGVLPGVVGSLQAMEAVKLILGLGDAAGWAVADFRRTRSFVQGGSTSEERSLPGLRRRAVPDRAG